MKYLHLRLAALALIATATLFVAPGKASAIGVDIRVGGPPPAPGYVDRRWAPPYRGAVWIDPHYEWVNGRWAWVRGYYGYPPRRGAAWVPGRYHNGYWRGGYWR